MKRVVVVGAGLAGVCAAYLLDGACAVTLVEASGRLGGHLHSVDVGDGVRVDLAAQFFGPRTHPTYCRLVDQLGLGEAHTYSADMGTTIYAPGERTPRFVSPMFGAGARRLWPVIRPWNVPGQLAFFRFARAARAFEDGGDWSMTLEDWLDRIGARAKERLLLPWLCAMTGCTVEEGRTLSARAALAVAARGLPQRLVAPYRWTIWRAGSEVFVKTMLDACQTVTVRTRSPVASVEAARAHHGSADAVVLALPPHALQPLLAASVGREALGDAAGALTSFRTRMVIHRDPVYMPADRSHWSSYNACHDGRTCEASVWYGALHPSYGDLFKSWATARARDPEQILHEAEYRHPLMTPAYLRARERFGRAQGDGGLWFAGSWVTDVDLQESAVASAVAVARAIAPDAPNLRRLEAA